MRATNLKTEHLVNPIGIDCKPLRLSWTSMEGEKQTAYRVGVKNNEMILFDSGKVISNETFCRFDIKLQSREHVSWEVTLWDENDKISESVSAKFETGLKAADWTANWINPELALNPEERQPASYLKKTFQADDITDGRLYITAHGIYNVYLNATPIEHSLYVPGTSQYNVRLQVQTYDISSALKAGDNTLIVTLGDGWYRGSMANDMIVNNFGTDIALLCQLEVNGTPIMVSDESWIASQNGPLGLNDLMMGEIYDARKENITDWHEVKIEEFGYKNLIGIDSVQTTAHERFNAKLIHTPSGETVLDFGQNFSGYVEMNVIAKAGQKIILTHGETLDKTGGFTTHNFQNPRKPMCYQKIEYTCKEGKNTYYATKCYFGFRYVKVETEIPITGEEFIALAVYSDMDQTGFFECGNQEVNQLFQNALWSMKGNFVEVPTDCPTREKSGYSGDCQAFAHTAMYLMDCYPVLRKWLAEQCATQFEDGCVKQVAPDNREKTMWDGGAGWCDSMEIVPYRMMLRYHDGSVVEEHYESIKKWLLYCLNRSRKTRKENEYLPDDLKPYFADQGMHWGEWMEPGINVMAYMQNIGAHGEPEVTTAYLSYGCRLVSEMAWKLDKKEDAEFFYDASEKAKEAYRYMFAPDGKIESERQCRYVRPIALNLLSEEEKKKAADRLSKLIHQNGNKLNTGFLTTNELCRVLTDYGHADTAYQLLMQPECPGWLYPVKKGATTIWEQWDGINEEGEISSSLNHYSYGSIVGWLFDRVCGINVENGEIRIRPYPNKVLGYANAIYQSPLGKINSQWKYDGEKIIFEMSIPCNAKAMIVLPNGEEHEVETGEYHYIINN